MVVGVVGRVVVGDEVAGRGTHGVEVAGAEELGFDAFARHGSTVLAVGEHGLAGDGDAKIAALGGDDDALARAAGAGGEGERERRAGLLPRDDEAGGAVGVGLERDRAAVYIAEDGGFRGVGGELESNDLAGAIDVGGREGDAEISPRGRGEESRAEERCDEGAEGEAHRRKNHAMKPAGRRARKLG